MHTVGYPLRDPKQAIIVSAHLRLRKMLANARALRSDGPSELPAVHSARQREGAVRVYAVEGRVVEGAEGGVIAEPDRRHVEEDWVGEALRRLAFKHLTPAE